MTAISQRENGQGSNGRYSAIVGAGIIFGIISVLLLSLKAIPEFGTFGETRKNPELVSVYKPPIFQMVRADGSVTARVPTDEGMPKMPDCKDLGLDKCEWDAQLSENRGYRMIDVQLKDGQGKTIGRTQMIEVDTLEYEELESLDSAGIERAWLDHVQVDKAFRGNGLGRTMWKAGDAVLKITVGPGAVKVAYDMAGWGEKLFSEVPRSAWILKAAPVFAYQVN